MRTTLTLDDDVADALRQQMRLQDKTFKQVVNDALRRALIAPDSGERPPFKVKTFASGYLPGIDPLRLRQLDEELHDGESLRSEHR